MEDLGVKHIPVLSMGNRKVSRSLNIKLELTEENLDYYLRQEYALSQMCYQADQMTLEALERSESIAANNARHVVSNENVAQNEVVDAVDMEVEESSNEYSTQENKCKDIQAQNPVAENNAEIAKHVSLPSICKGEYSLEVADKIDDIKRRISHRKYKKKVRSSCVSQDEPEDSKTIRSSTDVTTFYFERSQGFSSIPTKGGSTLGMARQHFHSSTVGVDEYEAKKMLNESKHRSNMFYRKTERREKSRNIQALTLNQRVDLLESAQVQIEGGEEDDCANIRSSRQSAGCDCKDYCDPDICGCSLAGIECQVDRPNFPCGCSRENCRNVVGRNEYNHIQVRSHFARTIRKVRMENKGRISKRKQASPSKILFANLRYDLDIDMIDV